MLKLSEMLAGSTGLEPDSRCFSKLVMARDFWMQVPTHQWISSSDSVHSRPLASSDFDRDLGDILETTRAEKLRVTDAISAGSSGAGEPIDDRKY